MAAAGLSRFKLARELERHGTRATGSALDRHITSSLSSVTKLRSPATRRGVRIPGLVKRGPRSESEGPWRLRVVWVATRAAGAPLFCLCGRAAQAAA